MRAVGLKPSVENRGLFLSKNCWLPRSFARVRTRSSLKAPWPASFGPGLFLSPACLGGFFISLSTAAAAERSASQILAGYRRAGSSCGCCLSFCSTRNRLITVNSYTTLANILMIAIATKLVMLITALLFSQPVLRGRSPSPFYGRDAERIRFLSGR